MDFDDSYGPAFTSLSMPYISPPLNQPEAQATTLFGGTIPAIQMGSIPAVHFGVAPAAHFGTPPAITMGTPPAMGFGTASALGFGTASALGFGTPAAISSISTTKPTQSAATPAKTAATPASPRAPEVSAISRIGSTSVNYVHTPSPAVRSGTQQPSRTNISRTNSSSNVSNRHVESTQSVHNNVINRGSTSSPVRSTITTPHNHQNVTVNYDSHVVVRG